MKTKIKKIAYLPMAFLLIAFLSCEDNSEKIEMLNAENTALKENYQTQLLETRTVTKETDSLKTVIHKLQGEVSKLSNNAPTYKASSEDEKAIEELVNNLHKGWGKMIKNKDTNELLKYFMSKYTTGTVRINTDNIPTVKRSNDSNFEQHLQEIIIANDVSISFGQTKFLYTEVKGNFFVTNFRSRIRVYHHNKQVHTSSIVTQLAGEKKDGWKVGSYNWVNFNYD